MVLSPVWILHTHMHVPSGTFCVRSFDSHARIFPVLCMCEQFVWSLCWKMVCDKVVCEQVLCDKVVCVCVWASCVWKRVCDKVVVCDKEEAEEEEAEERDTESKTRTPHKDVGKNVVFLLVCVCYHWEQQIKIVKCLTEVDPDKNPRLAPSSSSSESPSPRKAAKPLAEEHPDICQRHRRHRFQSNGL